MHHYECDDQNGCEVGCKRAFFVSSIPPPPPPEVLPLCPFPLTGFMFEV